MTYCTAAAGPAYRQQLPGLGAVSLGGFNWAGWGAPNQSTSNDYAQPLQQNPLVPYIQAHYIPGYQRLSEKDRKKAFGNAHKRGAFRAEPGLQELGGDGLKTGEPKAFTNLLEVQQGSGFSRLFGGVGSVLGKLVKPLVKIAPLAAGILAPGLLPVVAIGRGVLSRKPGAPALPSLPVGAPVPLVAQPQPILIGKLQPGERFPGERLPAIGPETVSRVEFQPSPWLIAGLVGAGLYLVLD